MAFLSCIAAGSALSQTGATPPVETPEVAYIFLMVHTDRGTKVAHAAKDNRGGIEGYKRAAAASLNLTVADFEAVNRVAAEIGPLLDAVDAELRPNLTTLPRDLAVTRKLDDKKTQIKATIKQRLRDAVSPAGWSALNAYIEGEFRQKVSFVRVGK